jgi:flagellar motor protein MotB
MKSSQEISYEEIEPELDTEEKLAPPDSDLRARPRRGAGAGWYAFTIVLSGAAAALGYFSWQLLNDKKRLASEVALMAQARGEAQQGREDAQLRIVQLVGENGQEQARSAQAVNERDQLRAELANTLTQLDELRTASAASAEQLAEFKELRTKFQQMIDSGALDISLRRGRMIVEMPAAVLFDSGSAELSEAGRETVIQVAKVLRGVPRHRFLVGGHTDNVPAVKTYKSNWELSAARAVRVTETLTSHGMSAKRLVIAGYSEYDPVATNSNESGRQKNRRIEIILEPYVEQKLVEGLREAKATPKP